MPSLYYFKVRDKLIIMAHNSLSSRNSSVFRDAELALGHHCFRNCFGRQKRVEVNIPLSLLNMCFFICQYFLCFSDRAQAFWIFYIQWHKRKNAWDECSQMVQSDLYYISCE